MINELNKAEKAFNQLKTKQGEMITRHAQLGSEMKQLGLGTGNLSTTQRRLKTDISAANGVLDAQRTKMSQLADQQKRMNQLKANYSKTQELRGKLNSQGVTAIATGTAIGLPVVSAIKQYASFEDAMKGVAKQVDGARDDCGKLTAVYYDMAKAIKAIAEELPQQNGALDIAALVEGAARMGVQGKDNLLIFAKTAAKAANAFELPADQLADNLGKIANLYKIPIPNIEQLGDVINYLDDSAQSKGSDIIDVLQRMGGVADKLDFKKAAALGSTFLSLGAPAEVAASAANAMVRELSIATMQSDKFGAGLEALGLNDEALQKSMSTDAMGTITKVLEKIKTLKKEDQMTVTTQLFGKEYGDDAAKLANNLDELYRQLKLVNAEKAKGSMQRESDIDKDSLSSQWLLLKAGLDNVQSALGEKLRGSLMDIINFTQQVAGSVRRWVEANPELANTLVKVAAVVSVITIAIGGLLLAVSAILGPFAILRLTFGMMGSPIAILGKAITMLLGPLKMLTMGFVRMGIALLTTPIGWFILGIAAIAGAAYLIYKNWDGISKWFADLWDKCKAPVLAFWDLLKELFSWTPIGMLTMHWGEIWAFFDTLPDGAVNKGKAIVQGLIDGITAKWKTLMEKIKGFTQFLPDWVTGTDNRVVYEGNYTTGNGGISLATAGASGYGPRIADTPKLMPKASTTTVHSQPFYQLTIHAPAGMNQEQLGKMMMDKIKESERANKAAGRATLGDRH